MVGWSVRRRKETHQMLLLGRFDRQFFISTGLLVPCGEMSAQASVGFQPGMRRVGLTVNRLSGSSRNTVCVERGVGGGGGEEGRGGGKRVIRSLFVVTVFIVTQQECSVLSNNLGLHFTSSGLFVFFVLFFSRTLLFLTSKLKSQKTRTNKSSIVCFLHKFMHVVNLHYQKNTSFFFFRQYKRDCCKFTLLHANKSPFLFCFYIYFSSFNLPYIAAKL